MTTHDEISAFMAGFQSDPETQMAFVGIDPAEIAESLREFASEIDEWFFVDRDDEVIIGAIGADRDEDIGRAWLYGPFLQKGAPPAIEDDLWARQVAALPTAIREVDSGFNIANRRATAFALRHGFEKYSEGYFMICQRDAFSPPEIAVDTGPLHPSEEDTFIEIYQETFPKGDYTGRQLLQRRNEHRQIFGARSDGALIGYIYTEARPDFDESGIEYVGVTSAARGKGAGTALVAAAAEWIFGLGISHIELYARLDNPALHLYERLGWKRENHMVGYRKSLR